MEPEPSETDIYLRMSEDRDDDELGIERQRERAHKMREARDWPMGVEHVDNDRSAADHRKRRPGFEAMMERVEAGKVKRIIARRMDRLIRNRHDQMRLFTAAEQHRMMLCFIDGGDLDMSTPMGQMIADFLAGQARAEIKLKGERQEDAQLQAAQQGRRVGGRKPFGYMPNGLELHPEEAAAVAKAYDDFNAGVKLGTIAREWNAAGLRSGQTKWAGPDKGQPTAWSHDTVRLVLRNPRNAGLRRYKGQVVGKAIWPKIVDEEIWAAAEATLSARTGHPTAGRANQQLLTGVALCGVCGATVHAGGGNTAARGYRIYRCSKAGGHISRKLDPIDEFVSAVVVARLSRPDARELLTDRKRPDAVELNKQLLSILNRRDALAAEFADDDEMTPSQFRTMNKRLNDRLAAVEAELADAGRTSVLGPLVGAEDVQAVWDSLVTDRQRAVIDTLMTVRIMPVGRGRSMFRPESVEVTPK
ncbi:recombinase family protein [Amycolatopsis sp. Poz14]|uniref:recombinase family protein n=1 Tax=Amycolatopsis sp. Poz14 TaxID=1447705 RepID=UPI001EE88DFB|nr:recombinase family protein [Amycolatopsis sp. Poz14]MCG3756692.1 recombinase family protein [Amycolatopsis sp. Poz14]